MEQRKNFSRRYTKGQPRHLPVLAFSAREYISHQRMTFRNRYRKPWMMTPRFSGPPLVPTVSPGEAPRETLVYAFVGSACLVQEIAVRFCVGYHKDQDSEDDIPVQDRSWTGPDDLQTPSTLLRPHHISPYVPVPAKQSKVRHHFQTAHLCFWIVLAD
ncbi:hypothetical protein M427DRAFT_332359 [Gonapodya prolifera JEL478]|uniref:Uncharacterized protein n=1 Tax=Gonapodya prolifera (strain JEL478) TaxID=1344416 RepID=A0A139AET7_GONPJ|nr:hypothetical protein M427DRAFT_332359 [Gonapodya prolifera JEL478]|eukprot:KXS14933.1 hypothetical protein M427DRAFT_332359 [Gonapodya prolifera JEL478]